jgi:hypothetical protein
MSATHRLAGASLGNAVGLIGEISDVAGPLTLAVENLGDNNVVVQVRKKSDDSVVALSEDTPVSNEDTAYDGDASTLVFTGQALNNTPIVPGTVVIEPTAGGNSVNLTDKDSDGKLYTDDNDLDFAGTVDYFTGALELSFPAGKDPAATNILADYTHQGSPIVPRGKRNLNVLNQPPSQVLKVYAASKTDTSYVVVEAVSQH